MRYHLVTLGCPKNVADSEKLDELLREGFHEPTDRPAQAGPLAANPQMISTVHSRWHSNFNISCLLLLARTIAVSARTVHNLPFSMAPIA